jgi:hypothetical protein
MHKLQHNPSLPVCSRLNVHELSKARLPSFSMFNEGEEEWHWSNHRWQEAISASAAQKLCAASFVAVHHVDAISNHSQTAAAADGGTSAAIKPLDGWHAAPIRVQARDESHMQAAQKVAGKLPIKVAVRHL